MRTRVYLLIFGCGRQYMENAISTAISKWIDFSQRNLTSSHTFAVDMLKNNVNVIVVVRVGVTQCETRDEC